MHSDLNLRSFYAGDPQKDNQLIQLLITCIEENYHNVAIGNYVKDQQISKQNASSFKPYTEEFLLQKQQQSPNISQFTGKIKQYSRLTLEVSETKFLGSIKQDNQFLQGYDIIAIKPKTEAVFIFLCTSLTYFDIITFDCFEKLPFIPKAKISQQLLEKNIMFEINYGDAVQDPNKRRQFISNAQIIINATKGKNIIMSSDTNYWLYHRSPYDLIALGITIGLKKDQATQAVSTNADMVIKHGKKLVKVLFVKLLNKILNILKPRKSRSKTNNKRKLARKQNYLKKLMLSFKMNNDYFFKNVFYFYNNNYQNIIMLSAMIPKFRYYQRLKQHMEINQNIRKENVDIQRTYHKYQKPLWAKMKQKVEDNKNRIYLFCGLIFLCQLKFAYEYNFTRVLVYLARIPYRRILFKKFKSFFLGLESVYPRPIVEQVFNNELPQQLISKFIQFDDKLPMGVTKKFIIHCLTECQVTLTKEQKREFYQKHGFLYGIYSKNSGINLKELNNFLKNLNVDPQKLIDVFDTLRDQEIQYQNRALEKMKQKQPQYSCNTPDAITRRIQPYFDTI